MLHKAGLGFYPEKFAFSLSKLEFLDSRKWVSFDHVLSPLTTWLTCFRASFIDTDLKPKLNQSAVSKVTYT